MVWCFHWFLGGGTTLCHQHKGNGCQKDGVIERNGKWRRIVCRELIFSFTQVVYKYTTDGEKSPVAKMAQNLSLPKDDLCFSQITESLRQKSKKKFRHKFEIQSYTKI